MTSKVKVNTVETESGSTLTLGKSGDTVTLASGASQSGFGRTGTVDWDTTAKTASFTAVSGNGYFINTSSAAITVTLPASPSAGAIVSLSDYTNTWQTNNVTVARNGSKIGGVSANATLSTEGQSVTFVYVDSTEGWKNVQDSTSNVTGNAFIQATGGTVTTCGDCKIHTFTSPGTFCVSSAAITCANNVVSYLVVAGGGGGGATQGSWGAGGGGAGGFREYKSPVTPYTASPLNGNPGGTSITVSASPYPITVGGGGAGGAAAPCAAGGAGVKGSNSIFSTITSTGGGFGGSGHPTPRGGGACGGAGGPGGSGGGATSPYAGGSPASPGPGGSGNTPPVSPSQGNPGGSANGHGPNTSNARESGGGGGATAAGLNNNGGPGGVGAGTEINPSTCVGTPGPTSPLRYFAGGAGGGGGVSGGSNGGDGGAGGGGDGEQGPDYPGGTRASTAGTTNTGGGGGGSSGNGTVGRAGGSGIVIIRYKFQ
jgi:hypothetical protein